jgi:hypothetical protein
VVIIYIIIVRTHCTHTAHTSHQPHHPPTHYETVKLSQMGKSTHLSLIDVVSLVKELKSLILDIRLQNVYSINSKTYLFKFYDSKTKRKVNVVAEKGTLHNNDSIYSHMVKFV